jgi:hypothetical protein
MISPFRMNLKPEWLPALSNLATLPPCALCAWQGLDSLPLPEEARQALLEEELFDPSGVPTPALISVINLLSAPSASLWLQLNNSYKSFDYRVFFSGQEGESASLLQNGNGLVLTAPARPNDLLTSLRQHTGDSLLQPVSFSADLPLTEALALAVLLDRYRDFTIHSIMEDSKMITPALSPVEMAEVAAGETRSPQWLTAVIRHAAGLSTTPQPSESRPGDTRPGWRGLYSPQHCHYLSTTPAADRQPGADDCPSRQPGWGSQPGVFHLPPERRQQPAAD